MNTPQINDGGPAFPLSGPIGQEGRTENAAVVCPGMTLRDYFAAQAMSGLIGDGIVNASIPSLANATGLDAAWRNEIIQAATKSAYDLADAMIAQRNKV